MKIRCTFKTPDAVDEAIAEAARGVNQNATEELIEEWQNASRKWFEYGEYVMVEWDTETNECRVVPAGS
jgi:hypothetical protein